MFLHLFPIISADPKYYEEVTDLPKLTGVLNDILDNYNMTFPTQMNLVFFVDALSHAVRISRILRQPRGKLRGVSWNLRSRVLIVLYDCKELQILDLVWIPIYYDIEAENDVSFCLLMQSAKHGLH